MDIKSKVICIDDSISPEKLQEITQDFPNWIKINNIYTIREILDNDDIVTGVLVNEIINPPKYMRLINKIQEPAFGIWRFRTLLIEDIEHAIATEQVIEV